MTCRLVGWSYKKAKEHTPAVAFVINGSEAEIDEVLAFVHRGFPIVVIQGTGGLADRIAACKQDAHTFHPDDRLMEICADGNIEIMDLSEVDGLVARQMVQRLFSNRAGNLSVAGPGAHSAVVASAWDFVYIFDNNATKEIFRARTLRNYILILGVAATTMARAAAAPAPELPAGCPPGGA